MPDPESIAAAASGVAAAPFAIAKVSKAVDRFFGPTADELADALKRYTVFRTRNVGRIVEAAERRAEANETVGEVPPRVAHKLLEDGSYCDDELMAEYFGGLLSASKTPGGRDDRAASWTALVSNMSSQQIRGHFLFYRAWATLLSGRGDVSLSFNEGRQQAKLYVELNELGRLMKPVGFDPTHVVTGLVRHGLLDGTWALGSRDGIPSEAAAPYELFVCVTPSPAGIELFGWAIGIPGLSGLQLLNLSPSQMEVDPPIDELASAVLPGVPSPLIMPATGPSDDLPVGTGPST